MGAREEKIAAASTRFHAEIATRTAAVIAAQEALMAAQNAFEQMLEEINQYYDALEERARIEQIIARGEPDTDSIVRERP